MAEKEKQVPKAGFQGSSRKRYAEKVNLSDRGNLTALRSALKKVKDRISKDGTTLEVENMVMLGGKRPVINEPELPRPTNPNEVQAASILRRHREDLCQLAIQEYEILKAQFEADVEERAQERDDFIANNPGADNAAIEAALDAALGPEPVEPVLNFPVVAVPDIKPEYEEMAKTKYELSLKAAREEERNLKKDEAKAISFIRQSLSDEYIKEMESTIPEYKRIEDSKDLVKYIEMVMVFHLTSNKDLGTSPENALDQLIKYFSCMEQLREETLTHWKERIEDQDNAIVILSTYVRAEKERALGHDDAYIAALPAIPHKEPKELSRKFVNGLNDRFSLFKEEYTRSKREYPESIEEAHAEAERHGPNDLKRGRAAIATQERVYAAKPKASRTSSLRCDHCKGGYHTIDECRYKALGLSAEDAEKRRLADRKKYTKAKSAGQAN